MPLNVPDYIEIRNVAGATVAYLSPETDSLKECWIDDILNIKSSSGEEMSGDTTISFYLPFPSEKWIYLNDSHRIIANGKEFVIIMPGSIEIVRDGQKKWGKVTAHETYILLENDFVTVSNNPDNPSPPELTVEILSGGTPFPGCSAGSAKSALSYLLQGTEWSVGTVDVSGVYDLETEKETILANIKKVQELWGGILIWDSLNKTVSLRSESWQPYNGFQIRYGKNEKQITRNIDYDIITKLYPFGRDDLDISSVEPSGKKYITNFSYSSEVRSGVWQNQDISSVEELLNKGQEVLDKLCRPRYHYSVPMVDVRALPEYAHEHFSKGDMVDLMDEEIGVNSRIRIIRHKYNVFQPWKCELELGDPLPGLERTIANIVRTVKGPFNKVTTIANTTKTNFDRRNDRISAVPANPTVKNDGTAIDHTINTDGTANISFEWSFSGAGDAYDIDGFTVYVYVSDSPTGYNFGTDPLKEQLFYIPKNKRAHILTGFPADRYYTFGVSAYRNVDNDIAESGVLESEIIKPSNANENPYHPSSNVEYSGDIVGTVKDKYGYTIAGPNGLSLNNYVGYGVESGGVITVSNFARHVAAQSPFVSYDEVNKTITVQDTSNFPASGTACFGYNRFDYVEHSFFSYTSKDATKFYDVTFGFWQDGDINYIIPNAHIYLWPTATANISVSACTAVSANGIRVMVEPKTWAGHRVDAGRDDFDGWQLRYVYIDPNGNFQIASAGTSGGWDAYPPNPPPGSVRIGYLVVGYGTEEPDGKLSNVREYDANGLPIFKVIVKHDIRYRDEMYIRTEDGDIASNLVSYGTKVENISMNPQSYKTIYLPIGPGKKVCNLSITANDTLAGADNLVQGANFSIGRRAAAGNEYGIKILWGVYVSSTGQVAHVDQKRTDVTYGEYVVPPDALNAAYTVIHDMDLMPYPDDPSQIAIKIVFYNHSNNAESFNLRFNWYAN